MKSIRNLTRMTYETTAFKGWRLALSSKGTAFIKYFSDRKYGDEKKAFAAAEAALAGVKAMLEGAIPGHTYLLQRSTDLNNWQTLATLVAGTDGAMSFTDESPPPGSAYYRLAKP